MTDSFGALNRYGSNRRSPTGAFAAHLGLEVAGFAAWTAIVNAVLTQADFIEALAQTAVLVAGAGSLRLVADHAHKFFGHGGRLSRFWLSGNGPMVDDLAVDEVRMQKDKSRGFRHSGLVIVPPAMSALHLLTICAQTIHPLASARLRLRLPCADFGSFLPIRRHTSGKASTPMARWFLAPHPRGPSRHDW